MGYRIMQQIYTCSECGKTPDHGDAMYEMGRGHWCLECCDKNDKDDVGEKESPAIPFLSDTAQDNP